MTGSQDPCGRMGDASLYVLGQLRGRPRESYERHLRRCEECAEEVELLQNAADAVSLLAPRHVAVPGEETDARAPVLAAAAASSVSRSASAVAAGARSTGEVAAGTRSAGNDTAVTQARAQARQHEARSGRPPLRQISGGASRSQAPSGARTRSRLLRNPVPKPALIGLALLAILAVVTVSLSSRAADVRYARIQAGWEHGGAALKFEGNQVELLVEGMPRPTAGHGYQVWVLDRLTRQLSPTSAWLHLNRRGQAGVNVPGDYHGWDALAVYVEPLHGSHTIHSGAVIVGDLRHQL